MAKSLLTLLLYLCGSLAFGQAFTLRDLSWAGKVSHSSPPPPTPPDTGSWSMSYLDIAPDDARFQLNAIPPGCGTTEPKVFYQIGLGAIGDDVDGFLAPTNTVPTILATQGDDTQSFFIRAQWADLAGNPIGDFGAWQEYGP